MRTTSNRVLVLAGLVSIGSGALGAVACNEPDSEEELRARDASADATVPRTEGDAGPDADAGLPFDGSVPKPPFDPRDEPVTCATTPCAVQLVAGEHHFCARMSDGTVRCWGDNTKGQLGVDDANVSPAPPDGGVDAGWLAPTVTELATVTQLAAGGMTTCALLVDGGVQCWGDNARGQLGLAQGVPVADFDRHPSPSPVALEGRAGRIDVGPTSACAVLTGGEVWCWGENGKAQLARASTQPIGAPAPADLDGLTATRIGLGTYTGFALSSTGEIASWGAVAGAEGSVAARETSLSPDAHPLSIGLGSVTSFAVSSTTMYQPPGTPAPPRQGIGHACAIAKGEVYCWGATLMGSLGSGLAIPAHLPRRSDVRSEDGWPQQIAVAGDLSCIRLTDGTVQCAGDNELGALGRAPTSRWSTVFEPVDSFDGHAVAIAAAVSTVCALVQGGQVVCWGGNQKSELGQGFVDIAPHPAPAVVRF